MSRRSGWSSTISMSLLNMRVPSPTIRVLRARQGFYSPGREDQPSDGRPNPFQRRRHTLVHANDVVVDRATVHAPRPVKAGQGSFPIIEHVFTDQKSITAWADHLRDSPTCTRAGACEGRLSTQAEAVNGVGPTRSTGVMPPGVRALMRRRARPSSRPH